MERTELQRGVKSDNRLFTIIEHIRQHGPIGVTQLAEDLEMPKSTVHKHLVSLETNEFVVKDEGTYNLGLRFLECGAAAKEAYVSRSVVQPVLDDIADKTSEAVWFVVEEHGLVVHMYGSMGDAAIQTYGSVGKRSHMHYLAAGKAILAHLPPERIDEIIRVHGLPSQTEQTVTSESALKEELSDVRERGYATNKEEVVNGLHALGIPVFADDQVLGAIVVSGPASRMSHDNIKEQTIEYLNEATEEIALRHTYNE
jgi:DNA-binding IclR family transcriptional regulator